MHDQRIEPPHFLLSSPTASIVQSEKNCCTPVRRSKPMRRRKSSPFLSIRRTAIPRLVSCQAASQPAKPAIDDGFADDISDIFFVVVGRLDGKSDFPGWLFAWLMLFSLIRRTIPIAAPRIRTTAVPSTPCNCRRFLLRFAFYGKVPADKGTSRRRLVYHSVKRLLRYFLKHAGSTKRTFADRRFPVASTHGITVAGDEFSITPLDHQILVVTTRSTFRLNHFTLSRFLPASMICL